MFAYFEPIEYTFKNKGGSSLYIKKFNLTEKDIQLIGGWYVYTLDNNYSDVHDGPGIGISFLPNRKLVVFQNGYNRQKQDYYLAGNWKIIENEVYCNIEYRIQGYNPEGIEKLNFNNNFIKIFTLEDYKFAYVNKKPFEFNNFDEKIKKYLLIDDIDRPRFRTTQDEVGSYWDYMDNDYELGNFLLNKKIESKENVLKMIKLTREFRAENK